MMQVYLTIDIDGEEVRPSVGVMSTSPGAFMTGSASVGHPDLDTVRLGVEITNKVLGFAEGLRREP